MSLARWPALVFFTVMVLAPQAALAICGDNNREASETCDDGNATSGDGCSSTCQVEAGFVCESSDFTLQTAQALPGGTQPGWTLSGDRRGVTQSQNSVAGVYTTNMPADIGEIVFTMRVNTTEDDDFIGWTVGYDLGELSTTGTAGDRDFLYFNWKQAAQDSGGFPRPAGLWLSRVTGPVTDSGMWTSTGNATRVATAANFGTTGWIDFKVYRVRMRYSTNRILVWINPSTNNTTPGNFVAANEQLAFDLTGNFPAGNFGFYTQSQEGNEFRLISVGGTLGGDRCSVDSDGDGIKDRSDRESDGDGIPDLVEMPGFTVDPDSDTDLDGVADWNDPDHVPGGCTGTGSPARCVALPLAVDRDQDGLPNHLDLDSDGDGLPDAYEAGLVDLNLNGLPDMCMSVDAFGVCSMGGLVGAAPNADGDALPNYLDTDSDNDGLSDTLEGFDANGDQVADVTASGFDTFKNGLDDAFDPRCTGMLCGGRVGVVSTRPDADGNGVHNYLQVCGDAYKIMAEGCDDGNAVGGDGCSSVCAIETGYVCPGAPRSVCSTVCGDNIVAGAEACDDNNTTPGDGCSALCAVEPNYTCPTAGGQCLTVDLTSPAAMSALTSNTVTYSGTATPGATVTVVVRDGMGAQVDTFTVIATPGGVWTTNRSRPDGAYTATASVTTTGGTYSDAANSFRVDATAPAIAIAAPANNSRTTDNTPTISGTATDAGGLASANPVTVEVRNAQNAVVFTGTPAVGAGGAWTVDTSALADGTYTVRATARDAAGNSTTAGPVTVTVDATAPAVAVTAPTNNARTTDNTPTLSGTASDAGGLASANPVTVEVRNAQNAVVFTSNPTVTGGAWTVDATTLADGTYTVRATARDAAGNSTTSSVVTFTVDATAPAVAVTAPANNSFTTDTTPTLSGTASDAGGLASANPVTVEVRNAQNAVVFTGNPSVNGGAWTVDATALPEGVYTVRATARDAAGNSTTSTVNTFTIDATAPAVTLTAPANNVRTNDTTPTIAGTATDAVGLAAVDGLVVTVRNAQGAVVFTGRPTVAAGGAWTVDTSALAAGTYTVTAVATDRAGATSTAGPNTFIIDTTAPAVAVTAPVNNSFTTDTTPTISGTASDAGGLASANPVTVEVRNAQNAVVFTGTPAVGAGGAWTVDTATLADGTYTVRATARDAAGNSTTSSVVTFTVDNTPPAITISAPANGSVTNDNTPTLRGTASDAGGLADMSPVTVEVLDAQGAVVFTANLAVPLGNWTINTMPLADGDYTVRARVTDAAGNVTNSAVNAFRIDTQAPVVTITSPADGAITANQRPPLSGTSEPGSEVVVEVRDNSGAVIFTETVTADLMTGAWSATLTTDLASGMYSVRAVATDLAGNVSQPVNNGFTIDTTVLPLDITTPVDGAALSMAQPAISGTTAPSAVVTIELRDGAGALVETLTATADAAGAWSVTPTMMLADGAYVANARVTTQAGVTSTDTTGFTVDTQAPMVSLVTPADGASLNVAQPAITGMSEAGAELQIEILDAQGMVVETLTATADLMGAWSVTPTAALADGDYTVSATASDRAGNSATAGPNAFTIDTVAPSLAISAPTQGATLGARDVEIAGTSEAGQEVVVELLDAQGAVVGTQTVTADANGAWLVTFPNLTNGAYTANASATDAASNVGQASVGFTVDSAQPELTVTSPADMLVTNNGALTVSGVASVDAAVEIVVRDGAGNEVARVSATLDVSGAFSVVLDPALADGAYTVEITATRPNGLSTSETRDVVVDTMAPVTTISQPGANAIVGDSTPTITGTSEPGATVTVSIDGQVVGTAVADAGGMWSLELATPLAEGEHTIEAAATDAAGNAGAPVEQRFTVDTDAPMVTITAPMAGEEVTDTTPTISGTAEPGATVTIIIDGQVAGTATADANGAWTFDAPELTPGSHTVEATSVDEAGNMGSSGSITFEVGEEQTTAPVVITSPTDGGAVTGPSVTVTGTGEPGATITVTIGDQTKTVVVGEDGSWSVTFDDVPAGQVTIEAGDGSSMTSVTVTVNDPTIEPESLLLSGAGGCAQGAGGEPASGALWLAALGLVALRRRRRA